MGREKGRGLLTMTVQQLRMLCDGVPGATDVVDVQRHEGDHSSDGRSTAEQKLDGGCGEGSARPVQLVCEAQAFTC